MEEKDILFLAPQLPINKGHWKGLILLWNHFSEETAKAAGSICVGEESTFYPEDVGSKFLSNIGKFLPEYMESHPTRQKLNFLTK